MNNNRKALGIIVVILGLLIIGLVVYLFFFDNTAPTTNEIDEEPTPINNTLPTVETDNQTQNITTGDRPRNMQEYDISEEEAHEINEHDLMNIAEVSAERFGSYSNYSNYSNFSDLRIFMTDKMKTWAENYVTELRNSSDGSDEYFGVTTSAITSKVLEYETDNKAVIMVTTQRQETGSTVDQAESYNQDIEITLLKVGGSWLVDSAYWQ